MCGIVAIWSREAPVDPAVVQRAMDAQTHRGPDQGSLWLSPDRRVGLGHRRLAIIDLETGDQPMRNESSDIRAVVNGEFYGFEKIRSDLERRGHVFATKSDSEILVHLYEEQGIDAVHHLRGEFAFVLWDQKKQVLLAGRDRFGIKPLFVFQDAEAVTFSSEVKALFAAGIPRRWDYDSLYQQLYIFAEQDRTLFHNVRQVPPGTLLEIREGHVRCHRYWDLDYPRHSDCSPVKQRDVVARVRELLDDSVRVRMRADVPVSSFLSGGIDSSAVVGFAARHTRTPVRCFTVSFAEEEYDELSIALNTARAIGAEMSPVSAGVDETICHFRQAVAHAETLGVNWHGVARYQLCRSIHQSGYKVALTGEGGDETFAGYLQFRQDIGSRTVPADLAEVASQLGFVPAWIQKLATSRSIFSLFLRDKPAWSPYVRFIEQLACERQFQDRHPVHQSLYLWIRSVLLNYILYAERLEMAHAVETRMPLLDHHLFEYVRTLPIEMLICGTTEKHLLRDASRHVVTEEVYRRPKHPFFAPPAWRDGGEKLQAFVQDTLRSSAFQTMPFFDAAAVRAVLDRMNEVPVAHRQNLDTAMLMMVSACVLQQTYGLSA